MTARWVGIFCTLLIMALPLHGATSAFGGGPAGGNIRTLAIDPSNPSVIYAGTAVFENYFEHNKNGGGVFKTTDGGQSWTATSSGLPDDPVQALAVDPNNPGIAYVGTMDQGIFKTVDGGQSWSSANIGLSDNFVFVITLDPSNPSTLYAGTTGAAGFFKSTNAGQSWAPVNLGFPSIGVTSLAFDPTNTKIIYVGTTIIDSATTGLFKSTDGGQSWILTNAGLIEPPFGRSVPITGITVDPTNPTVLYVAGGAAGSVFKSIDSGQSWTLIALRLGVSSILIDPSRPATLYAAGIFGSFKSTDGGASWVATNSGLTDTGIQTLVFDPASPSTLYLGTSSDGAFKSIDGGQSWSMANTGITARSVGALAVDPSNSATLYAGSVMSLFKTTDGGATWNVIDNGIDPALKLSTIFGFLALTVDPTDSNNVYAGGTIPTTLLKSANAGQFWAPLNEPFLNSVSAVVVDPTAPSTVYAGSTVNGVLKSTDGGQTWALTPLTFSQGKTVASLALDPSIPATLYAGSFGIGGGVYKTTDGAQSWAQALSSSIMSVTVNPLNTAVVYAGSATGDIYKTADSGQTWTLVQTGITDASGNPVMVRALAIDPVIPTTIYAGTFGVGVFKSVDGGQSWSAINTGLLNLRILRLVVDPASASIVYAGTLGAGVFKSTNGGQSWQGTEPPPGTGTPAIFVSPTQITFPPTTTQTTSAPVTVTVSNPGTAALLISDISTQDPFKIINPSPNIGNVEPGTTATFDMIFSPTAPGSFSGSTTITSNAPTSPTVIPLQGVGVLPSVSLSTTTLTFATQLVNSTGPTKTVALTNTGIGTLIITAITAPTGISLVPTDSSCPYAGGLVSPGHSCTIDLALATTAPGEQAGAVTIADNAANSPQRITANGLVISRQVPGLLLSWPLPTKDDRSQLSQGYAEYNLVQRGSYHTGIDIVTVPSGVNVNSAAPGAVIQIQLNGGNVDAKHHHCQPPAKLGAPSYCADHGYGNTVTVEHTLSDGRSVFTQYSHLSSIDTNLLHDAEQVCGPRDPQLLRIKCAAGGVPVATGTVLGVTGNTGYGTNYWSSVHLHFELKSFYTFGTEGNDAGVGWGYTKAEPDQLGYFDPLVNLHNVSDLASGKTVTANAKATTILVGPGGAGTTAYRSFGVVKKGSFSALRLSEPTTMPTCILGWYQIVRLDAVLLKDGQTVGSAPAAWICADNVQ